MSDRVRGTRALQVLVAAVAVLATASSAIAGLPQERPQFRTTVEIVQLQVQVADSRGYHVPRLEVDDFALRVNGELRDLAAVYEVDLSEAAGEPSDDAYVPPAGWRQFMLFFDFSFSTKAGILRAREAARNFVLEQTHPRDLVAVAAYSAIGGLRLVSPFTGDRRQVLDALDTFGLAQGGNIVDPAGFVLEPLQDIFELELANVAEQGGEQGVGGDSGVRSLQRQAALDETFVTLFSGQANDFRRYREQVVSYADQLVDLGTLLQATNGRKHVLLFSAGFSDEAFTGQSLDELAEDTQRITTEGVLGLASVNSETRFGSVDLRDSLQKAVENFRHADVVFHAFDVGGLGNQRRDDTFATTSSGKQGLSYIADGTDGTVHWNINNLTPNLGRLAEETSRYYVIAYRKLVDDPSLVDLDVEILRAGVRVVAAPKRFAPPPEYTQMDDAQRQLQLAEFIAKGIEEEAMTFDIRAVPFAGRGPISKVAVVLEVPFQQLQRIAQARGDGSAELDILGYVLDDRAAMRDLFSRRVTLKLDDMTGRMAGLPFRYYDLLWSMPGKHRVRLLVRDSEAGLLSTRTVDIDVPAFADGRGVLASGAVAVDAAHPGLLMRGFDPAAPPKHRAGGPIAYPFTLGDQEVTPQVYTVTRPGGTCQFMMVSYNIAKHPFTGKSATMLDARVIDESGREHAISELAVIGRHYDAETDGTALLVEARFPATLTAGAYLIEIDLVDTVAGQMVQQVLPLLVTIESAASEE